MKKIVAFLIAFSMVFSLTACGGSANSDLPNTENYGTETDGGEEGNVETEIVDETPAPTWQELYWEVVGRHQGTADSYALHDMDGDSIPELIIQTEDTEFPDYYAWSMYSYNSGNGMVSEIICEHRTGLRSGSWLNPFGTGTVDITTNPGNGETFYVQLYVVNGKLEQNTLNYFTWDQESEENAYFANFKNRLEWCDITDESLINSYK